MPGLQLKVGADISQAVTALKQYGAAVTQAGATTQAAASAMTGSVDKMQQETVNVFKSFTGVVVPAGTSWNGFVSLLKGPTKAAIKEATGQLLSCGEATREVAKEWALYKEQMQGATQAAQQVVNIPPPAPPSGNVSLDFTDKINAAIARIHANIDEASNAALGIGPKIAEGAKPGMTSLAALEAEMDRLKTAMSNTSNMSDFQKLSVQFGAVKLKADELRNSFISLSQVKVVNASMVIPSNLVQQVTAFGGGVRALPPLMDRVNSSLAITNQRTQQLGRNSGTASLALINTGRVLQDLPFGIMGVANNINPLLEGFQRLSAEAKSTGVSMGSLLKSAFLGGGGLGLAVSALTAAVTFASIGMTMFSHNMNKAGESADKIKEKAKKLKETLEDLLRPMQEVSEGVQIKAVGDSAAEIAKIRALTDVVLNNAKSYKERSNALNELKEINKSYFGDLTLEADKLTTLKSRVDEYTQSLVAAAVVKGFQDEISKLAPELERAQKELDRIQATADELKTGNKQGTAGALAGQTDAASDNAKLNYEKELTKSLTSQKGVVFDLRARWDELQTSIQGAVGQAVKFKSISDPLKPEKTGDKSTFDFFGQVFSTKPGDIQKHVDEMYDLAYDFAKNNLASFEGLTPILTAPSKEGAVKYARTWWNQYSEGLEKEKPKPAFLDVHVLPHFLPPRKEEISNELPALIDGINDNLKNVKISFTVSTMIETDKKEYASVGKTIAGNLGKGFETYFGGKFAERVNAAMAKGFTGESLDAFRAKLGVTMKVSAMGIEGLGNAFGGLFDALTSGGNAFQSFGQSLKNALKGIAVELMKDIALAGVLSLLTGGAGAAGGKGLSFISALKGIMGFADGGLVYGPTYGLIGEGIGTNKNNPEVVAPLDKLRKMIGGRSVEPQVILVQNTLRGKDLVLQAARTKKSQGRTI